jgi:hypothetical protein
MRFAESVISVGDPADGRKSDTGIPAAEMVEFEVMVRPIEALRHWARKRGTGSARN